MSDLTVALDRLYAAFAGEARPGEVGHCPSCLSREGVTTGLLAPVALRELAADAVADYAAYAMTTVGSGADFRYFAPRVLEVALVNGVDYPELPVVLGKFRLAGWTGWPDAHRHAVRQVLRARWRQTVTEYPTRPGVDEVLCAIGNAEDDLGPYLADWSAALAGGAAAPARQLRELVTWSARAGAEGRWRLTNAFWDHRDGAVGDWLAAPATLSAVRAGFDAASGEDALAALTDLAILLGA